MGSKNIYFILQYLLRIQQLLTFEFRDVIFTFLANRSWLHNLPQLPHTLVYARETKIYYSAMTPSCAEPLALQGTWFHIQGTWFRTRWCPCRKNCDEPSACKERKKFQSVTDFIQRTCLFWDEEKGVWQAKVVYFHQLSDGFEEYHST